MLFLNSMRRSLNKAAANFFRGHLKTLLFIYNFIWSNYLSIYLEIPKHRWYENEIFNKIGFAKNKPNNGWNTQNNTRIISYSIFLDFDCFYKSHSTERIENIWRGKNKKILAQLTLHVQPNFHNQESPTHIRHLFIKRPAYM